MRSTYLPRLTLFLFTIIMSSCAGAQPEKDLPYRVQVFNEHLRWGRFDRAAEFVVPMRRSDFIAEREEQADKVRLSECEILSVRRGDPNTATVRVELRWNSVDSTIVQKSILTETWKRAGSTWFVVSMKTESAKDKSGKK